MLTDFQNLSRQIPEKKTLWHCVGGRDVHVKRPCTYLYVVIQNMQFIQRMASSSLTQWLSAVMHFRWTVFRQLQCSLVPFPDCSVNHSLIKTVLQSKWSIWNIWVTFHKVVTVVYNVLNEKWKFLPRIYTDGFSGICQWKNAEYRLTFA